MKRRSDRHEPGRDGQFLRQKVKWWDPRREGQDFCRTLIGLMGAKSGIRKSCFVKIQLAVGWDIKHTLQLVPQLMLVSLRAVWNQSFVSLPHAGLCRASCLPGTCLRGIHCAGHILHPFRLRCTSPTHLRRLCSLFRRSYSSRSLVRCWAYTCRAEPPTRAVINTIQQSRHVLSVTQATHCGKSQYVDKRSFSHREESTLTSKHDSDTTTPLVMENSERILPSRASTSSGAIFVERVEWVHFSHINSAGFLPSAPWNGLVLFPSCPGRKVGSRSKTEARMRSAYYPPTIYPRPFQSHSPPPYPQRSSRRKLDGNKCMHINT